MKPTNETFDEEYFLIELGGEGDTDELCEILNYFSIDDLKRIQRALTYATNIKLYGKDYYDQKRLDGEYERKRDWEHQESGTEDWEHQSDWTILDDVITIDDVSRAKEYLKNNNNKWTIDMDCITATADFNWCTPLKKLDNLPCPAPKLRFGKAVSPIQKEQQMNCYQTPAYNEVQQAKQHLNRRVDEVYYSYGDKLHETFNMGHARPKNVKQAKDWLARGGMTVDENDDECCYVNVRWQDPDKPRNEEGFKAARLLLGKDYQNAKDAILVKTAEDGLKALQEFEAKVYN